MKTPKFLASIFMAGMALSAIPCFAQNSPDNSVNDKLLRQYFSAYEKKDWHIMEQILDDGFTFTSPAGDNHIDLATYKGRCWPNSQQIKNFDLETVIISGDEGYVTYNGWTYDGRMARNAEHFKFRGGRIISDECFFGPGVNYPSSGKK